MMGMSAAIRVGSAPLGFPTKLSSDPFLVLGSMVRDNTGTTILSSMLTPDSAKSDAAAKLRADGFSSRPLDVMSTGGFHPPSAPPRPGEPLLMCRANEVVYRTAFARRPPMPGSLLAVSIQRSMPGTCYAIPRVSMQVFEQLPMPDLRLPDDATDVQGGGTSASSDRFSMSASFTTKLDDRALTVHFADQLVRQGWVRGTSIEGEGSSASRYTKNAAKGEPFSGLLLLDGAGSRRALTQLYHIALDVVSITRSEPPRLPLAMRRIKNASQLGGLRTCL